MERATGASSAEGIAFAENVAVESAMPRRVKIWSGMLRCAMQCEATVCCAMPCYAKALLCYAVRCCCGVLCFTAWRSPGGLHELQLTPGQTHPHKMTVYTCLLSKKFLVCHHGAAYSVTRSSCVPHPAGTMAASDQLLVHAECCSTSAVAVQLLWLSIQQFQHRMQHCLLAAAPA